MAEVKTFGNQRVPGNPRPPFWIKRHQDAPVPSERIVDVADKPRDITIEPVIECITALVGTKPFVNSTNDKGAALPAFLFWSKWHTTI
jgi:hypothetical protein